MPRTTHSGARLLTVCGSLGSRSSNRAALDVIAVAACASGLAVDEFDRLAELPAFDPDRVEEPIAVVTDWRRRIAAADVVAVAAPEYAGAVAGSVKNAFDWIVGSGELYRKPVAVVTAGTSGGHHARQMLIQTLTWQGAYVVCELGIAAPRTKSDGAGRLTDEATVAALGHLVATLVEAPALPADELVATAERVLARFGIDAGHVAPPEMRAGVASLDRRP
jgi:chromate reductase, NAD(P)H dehydrogenase (quinone)